MTPPPDGSRDRRIEDPTNLHLVHPLSRRLFGPALAWGVSANAVSVAGLLVGAGAAWAFAGWREPARAALGLLLGFGWLVLDGLDGAVARATGTAGALGRFLDGLCDHGVFALLYVGLALSLGSAEAWGLAVAAGLAHAVQSSLYEGERARYHRRVRGLDADARPPARNALVRGYDAVAFTLDRVARRFDERLGGPDGAALRAAYGDAAARPMRLEALLSANTRVLLVFLACLLGDPRLFWWAELVPLTLVAAVGIAWHRRVEARLLRREFTPFQRSTGAGELQKDHRV